MTVKALIDKDKTGGIKCPLCNFATCIKDSREGPTNTVRRRRMCLASRCAFRFTTFEIIHDGRAPLDAEQLSVLLARIQQSIGHLQERVDDVITATAAAKRITELTKT